MTNKQTELELIAENTESFYINCTMNAVALIKQRLRGKHKDCETMVKRLPIQILARELRACFGASKRDSYAVAVSMVDSLFDEINLGNYDNIQL